MTDVIIEQDDSEPGADNAPTSVATATPARSDVLTPRKGASCDARVSFRVANALRWQPNDLGMMS
jgi:hypothetical protein